MSGIQLTCGCGTQMSVDSRRQGTVVRCPRCAQDVQVPRLPETMPTPAAPPPLPTASSPAPATAPAPAGAASPPGGAASPPAGAASPPGGAASPPPSPPPLPPNSGEFRPLDVPRSTENPEPAASMDPSREPPTATDVAPPPETPPAPPVPDALPGVEPSDEGRRSALFLAVAVALVGLFSAFPAMLYLSQQSLLQSITSLAMPRWVVFLLMLGGLHLAYAFYMAQLPDWSTMWVVAITMLVIATLDSILLATTLLGTQRGAIVQLLELHDQLRGGRAAGWCFIMLCLSITVAYCVGRTAARWHASETERLRALNMLDS